jgi:hypothetical protein
MPPCSHVQWLGLRQDDHDLVILDGSRLQEIERFLPNPSLQQPSLLSFVGKSSKNSAIKSIFPSCGLQRRRHASIANVCIDKTTKDAHHPLLLSDFPLEWTPTSRRAKKIDCHHEAHLSISWSSEREQLQPQDLCDRIHSRLFSIFTDVLCIFVDDCGGLSTVIEKLTRWASIGSMSTAPSCVKSRVVLVTSLSESDFKSQETLINSKISSIGNLEAVYSTVCIVNLPLGTRSTHAQFDELHSRLLQELQTSRKEKAKNRTLYSMSHFTAFFQLALQYFVEEGGCDFDFIKASRKDNPLTSEIVSHTSAFLRLSLENRIPSNVPLAFVASAILMDSYPPGMHCE